MRLFDREHVTPFIRTDGRFRRINHVNEHPTIVETLEGMLADWDSEMSEPSVDSNRTTAAFIEGSAVELIF